MSGVYSRRSLGSSSVLQTVALTILATLVIVASLVVLLGDKNVVFVPSPFPKWLGAATHDSVKPLEHPAVGQSALYTVNLLATGNTTANTTNLAYALGWTSLRPGVSNLFRGSMGTDQFTWNGTVTLALGEQLEFVPGQATNHASGSPVCNYVVGTVWANITYNGLPFAWSTAAAKGTNLCSNPSHVDIAPSWTVSRAPAVPTAIDLSISASAGLWQNGTAVVYGTQASKLATVSTPGQNGVNQFVGTSGIGSSGTVPYVWGWHWGGSGATTSNFAFSNIATSGEINYTSPYTVNATYNGVTQTAHTTGIYHGILAVKTIKFQPGLSASISKYSFPVMYTVLSNITTPFFLTYNYTIGAVSTATTFAATEVFPFNATFSTYVYEMPTPYVNIKRIAVTANTTWLHLSSWPSPNTFTSANSTTVWNTAPIPNATEVSYVAPNQYTPSTLTIVYVPTSPIFNLFGATLPFSAVVTYVNGVYAPYATFSVSIGNTYDVKTYDVFGHLLQQTNITASVTPSQVASISLNIWPMTVGNMNSSYVIGLLLTSGSVTQQSPDIMPLNTVTFYLPAGNYTVTLNYLLLNTPAIAKTITFNLTIAGVSYDVVTGISFLNIQTTTINTGANISRLIQNVNATFISTNTSVNSLVTAIQTGLFSFHLNAGTGSRTKNIYSFPMYVTNGANGLVNATLVRATQQALTVTYINNTGSTPASFFATAPGNGGFTLLLTPTKQQVAEIASGLGVYVLTSMVKVGQATVVAAGVIGTALLNGAVGFGVTSTPLQQQVLLNLVNTTRNGSSGLSTSTATWTNHFNGTFGGQVILTGSWLNYATNVEVFLNQKLVSANELTVTGAQISVFAGVANVTMNGTLNVTVSYIYQKPVSLVNPLAFLGSFPITPGVLLLLVTVGATGITGAAEYATGRSPRLAFAVLTFLLMVGAYVFLGQ